MLGLAYIASFALFLAGGYFLVRMAWRTGKKVGNSNFSGAIAGLIAAAFLFMAVFWNWIPVILAHDRMCSNDAGFRAYITAQEWRSINATRIAGLPGIDPEKLEDARELPDGTFQYKFYGGLLTSESKNEKTNRFGIDFYRTQHRIMDNASGTPLTQIVDYSVGNRDDARIWLVKPSCFPPQLNPRYREDAFLQDLRRAVK